jgi:tetratricopeptide (TPR) repeat protein
LATGCGVVYSKKSGEFREILEVRIFPMLRKLLMIVPLALFFSIAALAQTAAIEGNVLGNDGKPLQGAVIKIERQDVKGNYTVKTDKKGHYFYGGLPLGQFKVSVNVDGQERDFVNGVRGKVGDTQQVNFDLAKTAGAAPAPEADRSMSAAEKAEIEKKGKEQAAAMAKNKALNDAFNAGKTAAAANQWDAAIDGFTKASELDANQHVVWGNLADALTSRAKANPAGREADLAKAAEAYQKAIAIKGDDAAYHNNYALVLGNQKKFQEAEAEVTKAAQMDATNAGKYYFNLGAVYVNAGAVDPAAEAFKKAIATDPNYADAYYQYGLSLMGKATVDASGKMSAPAGTQEAFQKYLELRPDGPFAQPSKDMLASLGATVQTNFSNRPANQQKKK